MKNLITQNKNSALFFKLHDYNVCKSVNNFKNKF